MNLEKSILVSIFYGLCSRFHRPLVAEQEHRSVVPASTIVLKSKVKDCVALSFRLTMTSSSLAVFMAR